MNRRFLTVSIASLLLVALSGCAIWVPRPGYGYHRGGWHHGYWRH